MGRALSIRAGVDQGAMSMKECSAFPKKSPSVTSPLDCFVSYPGHPGRGLYPSAEIQSVYSTALADWTISLLVLVGEGG